jgi:hypothetical protein
MTLYAATPYEWISDRPIIGIISGFILLFVLVLAFRDMR